MATNARHPYQAGTDAPVPLPMEIWGTTDRGRVREGNEDTVFPHSDTNTYAYQPRPELLVQKGQLLLVADGVGGAQAGSEASRWVRRVVVERYYEHPDPNPASALQAVIVQANAALYQYIQSTGVREAGSTIVAAVIYQNTLYVAHVGDSRAYLLRNGQAYRLTQDHTLTQLKLMRGLITPEQAATDPDQGVLVRSMGAAPTVQVDVAQPVALVPGDVVLLCSDGLTDVLSDEEIARILNGQPPRKAAQRLIAEANRRGGPDNITVAIARVGGKAAVVPKPARQKVAPTPRARRGLRALTPLQWGIVLGLGLLVLAVFAGLAALMLAGRGGNREGSPTPPPTVQMMTPSPLPGPGGEGTIAPTQEPTSTPRPTYTPIPSPTSRLRRTPTPIPTVEIIPTIPGVEPPPPPPPPPPTEPPPPPTEPTKPPPPPPTEPPGG